MADEPVQKLLRDTTELKSHTASLQDKVRSVDQTLISVRDKLEIPITVANKLRDLDNTLNTTSQVLQVISIIPPIRVAAGNARMVINTFAAPVHQAASAAAGFAATVRPIRDVVVQLEARVQQVQTQLGNAVRYEQTLIDGVTDANRCMSALPAGEVKNRLTGALQTASGTIDPPVVAADGVVAAVLSTINAIESDVRSMSDRLQVFANVSGAIDSVTSQLRVLLVPMQAVGNVLSQNISVPYGGYPEICYEDILGISVPYPCGWHTVYFTFSIKQILDGISGVIRPIMDLLESAMYAILNPVLRALHLDFTLPQIPGLSDLANQLNSVVSSFQHLQGIVNSFAGQVASLNGAVDQVKNAVVPVQQLYNDCKGQKH